MKLLLVTLEYAGREPSAGGIGVFYRELACGLRRRGVQVHTLHQGPGGSLGLETGDRTVIVDCGRRAPNGPGETLRRRWRLLCAVRRHVLDWSPDLVETHEWAGPLPLPPGPPLLVRLHGAHTARRRREGRRPSRLCHLLEARTLASATAVVGVSRVAVDAAAESLPLPGKRRIAPPGVDVACFRPPIERRPSDEILFVGTLREEKGLSDLLAAARLILERHPAVSLTLIGPAPHETFVDGLLDAIPAALRPRIRREGALPRHALAARYGSAGVCVFPSRFEAFGLTCLEAMSCGAAVVGTRGTGHEEMIEDGVNGRLVDSRDPAGLAGAIEGILVSPARRFALGAAARRTTVERFTLDHALDRNLAIYRGVLAAARPAPAKEGAWAA